MSDKKRDPSVELLRLCMMFGIVLLHIITQDGYFLKDSFVVRGVTNILSTCVVGFVFISGYFGINMTLRKVVRLLSLSAFYAGTLGLMFGWESALNRFTHDWFLYGYIVLMLFSPLFNVAIESLGWRKLSGVLMAIYVWSYLCVIPCVKQVIPCPTGFAPLSFFTMFGIYIAARMYRKYDLELIVLRHKYKSMMIIILALIFVFLGFYHHNSIASLVFIGAVFTFVKRIMLPRVIGRVALTVAGAMFGVYLIHSSCLGHFCRQRLLSELVLIMPIPAAWLVAALIVFVVSMIVEGSRLSCLSAISRLKR